MATLRGALETQLASKTLDRARRSTGVLGRGYVLLILSSVAFSANGLLLKFVLSHFDSTLIPFWRVLLVAFTLGSALAIFRPQLLRIQARHLPLFALFGMVGIGLQQMLWTLSVKMNGVSVATVLVYISPAVVAVISWPLLKESFSRETLAALVLSTVGVAMVSRINEVGTLNFDWLGILVGVVTGVAWASYSVLGRFTTRLYSAWTVTFYAFSFATLLLLVIRVGSALSVTPNLPTISILFPGAAVEWWLLLMVLALGPTLGGFALYTVGLSHVPASVASLLGTLEPVLSIILAFFVFGEVLNWIQIAGAALILASVLLLSVRADGNAGKSNA